MDGCVYEEDGKCMKYTTDIVTSYCYGNGYPCKDRAITNAMKFRAMTDEEIEDWYWWMHEEMMYYTDSRAFVHDWLKQEATE